jgi:hypothetical protein
MRILNEDILQKHNHHNGDTQRYSNVIFQIFIRAGRLLHIVSDPTTCKGMAIGNVLACSRFFAAHERCPFSLICKLLR